MGRQFILSLLVGLLAGAIQPASLAQQVFRCGNSYSHIPCEGANTLPLQAPNSKAQEDARKANDANTRREMRLAEEMEKNRNKQEAFLSRAGAPPSRAPYDAGAGGRDYDDARGEGRKKSPYFTARTPAPYKPGKDIAGKDKAGNSTPGKP